MATKSAAKRVAEALLMRVGPAQAALPGIAPPATPVVRTGKPGRPKGRKNNRTLAEEAKLDVWSEKLIRERVALGLLDPQSTDRVLDLFCGLGNFTLPLARRAAHVAGVEGEAGLVRRAGENARRNGIANAQFFAADLAADQRDAPWAKADYDLVLLDPPRSGAEAVLEYLPRKSARRVVYVSCHPASLARDAATLVSRHGFTLRAAGAMDMFPHTAHVESIAVFDRK